MKNEMKILNVKITTDSNEKILEKIEKYIRKSKVKSQKLKVIKQKPLIIFTPNPEIVMYAQNNPKFKQIVNSAQINIPDGKGIVWASKIMGYPITERITGADLLQDLVLLALENKATIGLIGGFSNLALSSLECLQAKYPKLKGWAEDGPQLEMGCGKLEVGNGMWEVRSGKIRKTKPNTKYQIPNTRYDLDYRNWNLDEFIKRVKERNTKILFVGFGFPKQEFFIDQIRSKLNNIVLIAVGGTFDYLSGRIPRAPKWVQQIGLEWLYRLYKEPWRIRRQMVLPGFVIKIFFHKNMKTQEH